MKKTVSIILALMLLISLAACSSKQKDESKASEESSAATASQKETSAESSDDDPYPVTGNIVYFKDTLGWGENGKPVYVYYWSNSGEMITWPGAHMNSVGDSIYSYELPAGVEFLIFDNHSDNMSKKGQTRDIPYDGSVRKFQCSGKIDEMQAQYVTDWDGNEIGTNQIDDGSGANQLIVNVAGLTSIEQNDKFGVHVTGSRIDEGYYSTGEGADSFVFTVKNDTDKTLSSVSLFVLAYNPDEHARIIDLGSKVDLGLGDDAYIQEYESEGDLKLKPGESADIRIQSIKKTISAFRSIVSSYTANGETVKNSTTYEWYKNAYLNKVVDNSVIFNKLNTQFGSDSGTKLQTDDRGAVALDATVLFDYDSAELSAAGKASLKDVIDAYVKVVFAEDGTILVNKITVEGHTDTDGTHEYNQTLSENRANAVMNYCVQLHPELKGYMVAKGCADDNPVKKADGTVDKEASRRVCFVAE